METDNEKSGKRDEPYRPGRSNEGGNFDGPNTGSDVTPGSRRSENDPQNTSLGSGSQPGAVNLNNGSDDSRRSNDVSPNQDDTGRGDDSANSPGYGASNNAAGV
jgi:hypothetical protein